MAKIMSKHIYNYLHDFILLIDRTVEGERQTGEGYSHKFHHSLEDALLNAQELATDDENVYAVYLYQKQFRSHDRTRAVYTRILVARRNGTFILDDDSKDFALVIKLSDDRNHSYDLLHSFFGTETFQRRLA